MRLTQKNRPPRRKYVKLSTPRVDKLTVGPLLEQASEIFSVAINAAMAGDQPQNLHILVGPTGHLRFIANPESGWSPDRLREEAGAQAAYTIQASHGTITVEASTAATTCRLIHRTPVFPRAIGVIGLRALA